MSVANDSRSAGQDWVEIIGRKSLDAFAAAFIEDAVPPRPLDRVGYKCPVRTGSMHEGDSIKPLRRP